MSGRRSSPGWPSTSRSENASASASGNSKLLDGLDDRLDDMVRDWTQRLVSDLADPTVAANIDLVSGQKAKKAIAEFLKNGALPDPVDATLVKALQEVLSGLQKVVLTDEVLHVLHQAMVRGGLPCTVPELKERFEACVAELTRGKDPTKVRIVLE